MRFHKGPFGGARGIVGRILGQSLWRWVPLGIGKRRLGEESGGRVVEVSLPARVRG